MKWAEAYQQIREHHYMILDERESISKSARLSLSTWVLELLTECLDEAEQTEPNSSEFPNNCEWSVEYAKEMLNTMPCEDCGHWEHGAGDHYYCALLAMRQECCFESKDESTLMFANTPKDETTERQRLEGKRWTDALTIEEKKQLLDGLIVDEPQTDYGDYERAVEQMQHDMRYEPTYNTEDGSM